MNKKVAVALSGGVDSAVCALLLKNNGYEIVGITAKTICGEESEIVVKNAQKVAEKIGIEHYVVDVTKEFDDKVIKYFEKSYQNGETPNPCIMCNKYIKWGRLYDYAINILKVDYIATGHYADIRKDGDYYKLYPAIDEYKDQLYFLFMLSQENLSRTLFPLSKYKKQEVKELAEKYNLPPKSAKESQDICFIKPPMTTKKYLSKIFESQKGEFVEKSTGKVLGYHDGFWQYTIGQRKGIGLAAPEALYVLGVEPKKNIVYVGYKNELFIKNFTINNLTFSYPLKFDSIEVLAKIRYNMKHVEVIITKNNDKYNIEFKEPVSALAKGQAFVIYDKNNGYLIGGGII